MTEKSIKSRKIDSPIYIASSIAATWGWGFSLLTGVTVSQTRGLIPFIMWGTGNALALLLFGFLLNKLPRIFEVQDGKVLVAFTTLVRIFSVWIQMSAISETVVNIGYSQTAGHISAYALGAVYIISMYKGGIWGSIVHDSVLWKILNGAVIAIIAIGAMTGSRIESINILSDGQIKWGMWNSVLLLAGPIVDLSLIQRAKVAKKHDKVKSFKIASAMFGVYMVLIGLMSLFNMNNIMSHLLLGAVFGLSLSTLNSDAVALQRIRGKKAGLAIGLITVATWQFVKIIGFFNLWQIIANVRIYFSLYIVIATLYITLKNKPVKRLQDKWEWES